MKRLDKTESVFKIIAYVFVTIFAAACLYPLLYTLSASISGRAAVEGQNIYLFPIDIQFEAFSDVIDNKGFWIAYSNTVFYTFFGTAWSMFASLTLAYALSKPRLLFRRQLNFLLVFTMWFSAGMLPTYLNLKELNLDNRWGIVFAMGIGAYNIILLRNFFQSLPKEIEEAAIIDGANEFKIFTLITMPMAKAAIATVTMFYAISRWNGYFWARYLLPDKEQPLQVYMRIFQELYNPDSQGSPFYAYDSLIYAMIVLSIIPIILIYPFIQKYFAAGVNLGGVKG